MSRSPLGFRREGARIRHPFQFLQEDPRYDFCNRGIVRDIVMRAFLQGGVTRTGLSTNLSGRFGLLCLAIAALYQPSQILTTVRKVSNQTFRKGETDHDIRGLEIRVVVTE